MVVGSVRWSQKYPNVRYSHSSSKCGIHVSSVNFSRSVNVSSNKVSVVVVFVKNAFKVCVFVT